MRPLKCAMLRINLFLSDLFPSGDDRCGGVHTSTTQASAHPVPLPISSAIGSSVLFQLKQTDPERQTGICDTDTYHHMCWSRTLLIALAKQEICLRQLSTQLNKVMVFNFQSRKKCLHPKIVNVIFECFMSLLNRCFTVHLQSLIRDSVIIS